MAEDAEEFFRRLEREIQTGRAAAARIHIHREGERLHAAFALSRGEGRYGELMTSVVEDLTEFQTLFQLYAEETWRALFPDKS